VQLGETVTNLKHYAIRCKDANNIRGNTFLAYTTQVKIVGKAETLKSPYKSKILKGPITLPQSPAKHKKQTDALSPSSGNVLSKADGKKRQIDDDVEYVIKANEMEKKEVVVSIKKRKT
jgi:hypothetical protein